MAGSLRGLLALHALGNGIGMRQKVVSIGAGATVDHTLTDADLADYVLLFGFRGVGQAGKLTYEIRSPSVPGTYEVVDDDEEIVLGFERNQAPITIRFVSTAASTILLQLHMARFTKAQREDLRCWLNLETVALPAGAT